MGALNAQVTRRGLSLIETAITLPLILLLLCGMLEYGWMFLKSQEVTNAARQGARVGARVDALNSDIAAAVSETMTLAGIEGSSYVLTILPADVSTLEPGTMFTVVVQVPYDGAEGIGLGLPLIPTPGQLESAVTMAREGP